MRAIAAAILTFAALYDFHQRSSANDDTKPISGLYFIFWLTVAIMLLVAGL